MKYSLLLLLFLTAQLCVAQVVINTGKKSEQQPENLEVLVANSNPSVLQPIGQKGTSSGLVYVTLGSLTGQLSKFEVFFRQYLIQNYNVGYEFYGCNLIGPELAYMNKKNKELTDAFGEDFIATQREKAKELFNKKA
ncbi:hypothetical protein AAU57_06260 [Nonlabens sp. YIK11]|uniref:hypothetical protein n=1 Tax=Nonlabens sp. YIK11 TaxID=1453349 RepID=UPI000707EE07|nr:hypothetical protein [Nonlabens sp. YIK11]KQC32970.1 hypothetical protein AAU57_06260 [Nonlabens sp. YIK11]